MALIGTLTSGVSALRSFTKELEVIGNNISNVNTTGYKSSQVSFSDSLSNTMRGSAPSSAATSNVASTQVGTGVTIGGINSRFTQGALSTTSVSTDLGISGEGFFMVKSPSDSAMFATRAGEFRWDDQGYLVTAQGYRVQGLTGGTDSAAPNAVDSIKLRSQDEIDASWATDHATEIDAANVTRDGAQAAATTLNSLSTAAGTAADSASILTSLSSAIATAQSEVTAASGSAKTIATAKLTALTAAQTAANAVVDNINATTFASTEAKNTALLNGVRNSLSGSATSATSTASSAAKAATTAATPTQRTSYSIDKTGNVVEFYADGSSVTTNQILLQNFKDPAALVKQGNNLYTGFDAAGTVSGSLTLNATDNQAGKGGLGKIESGTLELSNVDLTEEFANLITTQRSFQASSRLITVSDTVLEDIVNLKR